MALASGARIDAYVVRRLIGAGGMGEVYLANDTRLDREVAVKVLPPEVKDDPVRLARLHQEALAVAALEHPYICRLYDVGPDYLVMEYLEGRPLKGPLPMAKALEDGLQILDALGAAHQKGIVHRDLKPANVLVTSRGVKLLDFGVATAPQPSGSRGDELETREALTRAGMVMGTPAYMAPEQLTGHQTDARVDLFSFGAVLYEMLTGRRAGPDRIPLEQAKLESVVRRCLAANPDDRFPSAADTAAALTAAARPAKVVRGLSAAAAVALVTTVGFFLWQRGTPAAPLTDQDVLVVADFDNQTADPVFNTALRQALSFQLQESPFLMAMDDVQLRQALAGSGRPANTRVTAEVARELCVREGHKATLQGSIVSVGSTYLLGLQAVNCATGDTIAREQATARDKNQVVDALATATAALRAKLGESLTSIGGPDRAYEHRVTTSSLEALQAFYLGDAEWTKTSSSEAVIPFYERATELDPNFGMAWAVLGLRYGSVGDQVRYRESIAKAYALRDKGSERERLFIESVYYEMQQDAEKRMATQELLTRLYPRDPMLHSNLAGGYLNQSQPAKALREAEETIRLGPRMIQGYTLAASALQELNRIDEARAMLRRAVAAGFDTSAVHSSLLYLAQGAGDLASVEAELQWFEKTPNDPIPWRHRANDAFALGQISRAAEFYQRAQELSRQPSSADTPGRFVQQMRLAYATVGMCERLGPRRSAMPLAMALCDSGEALQKHAATLDDAAGPAAYARGLAQLQANRPTEAAKIFDDMLEFRVANWGPEYPAALVGRARAAAASGDVATARVRYQTFLELWKDADRDLPLMTSARNEYSALR